MDNQSLIQICETISNMNKPKEALNFLNELLTQSELEDIVQRWNILKMLSQKESQRNIAKKLSVSLCKITRGAKILKDKNSVLRKIMFDESWQSQN